MRTNYIHYYFFLDYNSTSTPVQKYKNTKCMSKRDRRTHKCMSKRDRRTHVAVYGASVHFRVLRIFFNFS